MAAKGRSREMDDEHGEGQAATQRHLRSASQTGSRPWSSLSPTSASATQHNAFWDFFAETGNLQDEPGLWLLHADGQGE